MPIQAKICGINTAESMKAAIDHGAAHVGLVFFPPSPRAVGIMQAASLAAPVPSHINIVGLFVNPSDDQIAQVLEAVPLDIIQLHGKETAQRCAEIKARTGRQVMKAIGIQNENDLADIGPHEAACDMLLFDAKAPKDAKLPGGNAVAFDWHVLAGRQWSKPWMLAGGLNVDNVPTAVKLTGATCVDTSSGVEDAPGLKSPTKIAAFLAKIKGL